MSMQSKMIISGIRRLAGTSKKSGNNYDFCRATILEKAVTDNMVQQCEGYVAKEVSCDPALLMQLRGVGFPVECDVELNVGRDNTINIVRASPIKAAKAVGAA